MDIILYRFARTISTWPPSLLHGEDSGTGWHHKVHLPVVRDEVVADVKRKTKCMDITVLWDEDMETHWWRVLELELCGQNGIILNFEKFQFSQHEIDFAGFPVTINQSINQSINIYFVINYILQELAK